MGNSSGKFFKPPSNLDLYIYCLINDDCHLKLILDVLKFFNCLGSFVTVCTNEIEYFGRMARLLKV
jgi:hypothetical protein